MSWRAAAYVKDLRVCPNGEQISRLEKFVALVLADSHQDKVGAYTFPSVATIASDAMMDVSNCRKVLKALDRKGVIERVNGDRPGRGQCTFYRFPELDGDEKKGVSNTPFPKRERGSKEGQKGGKNRGASIEEQEHEQKQKTTPLNPLASEGSVDVDSAAALVEVKNETAGQVIAIDAGTEFDAEQLEHLARLTDPDKRAGWESYYRRSNRDAAEACALADELKRKADAERAELEREICDVASARAWVMRSCSWVDRGRKRGLGAILEIVIAQDLAASGDLIVTAQRMAKAWKGYTAAGDRGDLVVRYGPANFFALGLWSGSGWHFDEKKLRQRAEAGAGSL